MAGQQDIHQQRNVQREKRHTLAYPHTLKPAQDEEIALHQKTVSTLHWQHISNTLATH